MYMYIYAFWLVAFDIIFGLKCPLATPHDRAIEYNIVGGGHGTFFARRHSALLILLGGTFLSGYSIT